VNKIKFTNETLFIQIDTAIKNFEYYLNLYSLLFLTNMMNLLSRAVIHFVVVLYYFIDFSGTEFIS
jgi:hypothetical protein